jgi:hypothetical protein
MTFDLSVSFNSMTGWLCSVSFTASHASDDVLVNLPRLGVVVARHERSAQKRLLRLVW